MNPLVLWIIEVGVNYLLYFIIFLSVYRLLVALNEKELTGRRVRRKVKSRLRKQVMEEKAEELKESNKSLSNLELLLRATAKKPHNNPSVFAFLLFSGGLGIGTFLLIISRLGDLWLSTGLAIFVSSIPYLFLQVKFRKQKSVVGNNITKVIEILIHQYSANGHDMYRAVKEVAREVNEPHYRRLFLQITSAMQTRREDLVKESIDVLTFSIGGSWAKRLGNIIQVGYLRSDSVMKALVHLSENAQNTEGMLKQEQSAAFGTVVTAYATIPFMAGALLINRYLTRSFDYWDIQFSNPVILTLTIVTFAMIAVSILLAIYIRNPKNDL